MKKGYKQLLDEANAQVVAVNAADAASLHGDPAVVFVDLRDPREREREGTIPDAFSCPRGMLEFWIDPQSPYFKPIFAEQKTFVFHCASGWRSALSVATLQDMGFEAAHLADGFSGWKAAGGPVAFPEKKG
jgi:rhodanese-related sulfurtransferase